MVPERIDCNGNIFFLDNFDAPKSGELMVASLNQPKTKTGSFKVKTMIALLGAASMATPFAEQPHILLKEPTTIRQSINSSSSFPFTGRIILENGFEIKSVPQRQLTNFFSSQKMTGITVSKEYGIGYNGSEYLIEKSYATSSDIGIWTEVIDPMKTKGRHATKGIRTIAACPVNHGGRFKAKERVSLVEHNNDRLIVSSPYHSERNILSTVVFAGPFPKKPLG